MSLSQNPFCEHCYDLPYGTETFMIDGIEWCSYCARSSGWLSDEQFDRVKLRWITLEAEIKKLIDNSPPVGRLDFIAEEHDKDKHCECPQCRSDKK